MRTRTAQQWQYEYNGISPAEFGKRTGQSAEQVRALITAGWFEWTKDGKPECLDVSGVGSKNHRYKIHVSAVERFYKDRAVSSTPRGESSK